jgi:hypothetical protein
MFDLPQPLGPTMPITSESKWMRVRSQNDLNPLISSFRIRMMAPEPRPARLARRAPSRRSAWGATLEVSPVRAVGTPRAPTTWSSSGRAGGDRGARAERRGPPRSALDRVIVRQRPPRSRIGERVGHAHAAREPHEEARDGRPPSRAALLAERAGSRATRGRPQPQRWLVPQRSSRVALEVARAAQLHAFLVEPLARLDATPPEATRGRP